MPADESARDDSGGIMAAARPDNPELHGIQMLRAVAALAVVVHHTLEQSGGAIGRFSPDWLTTSGASGVDIFFVISGFIMLFVSFRPDRRPPTPGTFLFRRVTRIYPFYWLCCIAILCISAAGFLASHHYGAYDITASFMLLPGSKLIDVSWTLVYEIYFYLLFAAMLWFRSARIAIAGTTAAIVLIYVLSSRMSAGSLATFLSNPLPIEFCMGLFLAHLYSAALGRGRRWQGTLPTAVIGLAIMAIAPLFVAHPNTNGLPPLPRVAAWGVPAALVVASVLNMGPPKNAVTRFWVLLGDASYALYLTHVFVMIGYGRLVKIAAVSRLPQQPVTAMIVITAVAIGVAAHLLVEKPLLRLIRRVTHRQPGHAGPAITA